MSKSPINFNVGGLSQGIMGGLMARGGKKKTRRALKKIDKRLGSIEEKIDLASSSAQEAVPVEEGLDNPVLDNAADAQGIETPSMADQDMGSVPGAVQELQEDSYATAGSSGLNMMKRIARRK